jgi:hypothetical protein
MPEQKTSPTAKPTQSLSAVIPSCSQPQQPQFLRRAVASIKGQTVCSTMTIRIIVGIDHGEFLPTGLADELGLIVVASGANSQAAALNAAIRTVKTDLVAWKTMTNGSPFILRLRKRRCQAALVLCLRRKWS